MASAKPATKAKKPREATRKKAVLAESGARPLTAAEHRRLGLKPSARRYTTQAPGVKKLRLDKTFSRRSKEQEASGTTYERQARVQKAFVGGRAVGYHGRYYRARTYFAQAYGLTPAQAGRDPRFKGLWKDLKDERRTKTQKGKAISEARLQAAFELGEMSYAEMDAALRALEKS